MPALSPKLQTFADAQHEGTLDMLASSMSLGWQGISAHHFKTAHSISPQPREVLDNSFVMHTEGAVNHLRRRWEGRWDSGYSTPQALFLMPGSMPSEYGFSKSAVNIMFGVSHNLMTHVISEMGSGDPEQHEIQERFLFRDPLVEQIGWVLLRLLHEPDDAARLYAESLGVTLAHHMLRFYSITQPHITDKLPLIGHPQIRSALEYLHVHFAQPISLEALAGAAGLSVTHFTRLFRKAIGHSPHQYLLRLRCEYARKMLATGKYTVTHVSQSVGFYDHSHFVRHFKRLYGISPAAMLPNGLDVHRPK